MSTGPRPAALRFYFDADVMGTAKVLAGLRFDITYPGDPGGVVHRRERPPCEITDRAMPDTEWIPRIAAQGLLIVTRDARIGHRPAEIAAVVEHRAKVVALSGPDARSTWAQLEILFTQWRSLDRLADEAGSFMYTLTRTGGLKPVDLGRPDWPATT